MADKLRNKAPIRRIMDKAGAKLVAGKAIESAQNMVVSEAQKLTTKALAFAKHAKRKKITKDDMNLAFKYA